MRCMWAFHLNHSCLLYHHSWVFQAKFVFQHQQLKTNSRIIINIAIKFLYYRLVVGNSKLTAASVAKVFAKLNRCYHVTCSFILMKIKSFSWETFCKSTRSEKEANSNSEVPEVSLHKTQVVHQASVYPGFCGMKQLGVFLLPPG